MEKKCCKCFSKAKVHKFSKKYIYIYVYVCVCVCVCIKCMPLIYMYPKVFLPCLIKVCENIRKRRRRRDGEIGKHNFIEMETLNMK